MSKSLDNYGRITLQGIHELCEKELYDALYSINDREDVIRKVNYKLFRKVITLYLEKAFENLLNGYSFRMYNHFGVLRIIKSKMIRYNPYTYYFKRTENGCVREKVKLSSKGGYWYFVFWDCGKKYRHYRFKAYKGFKLKYMDRVNKGMDYIDMSLDEYGRNASETYKQKIL